MHVGSVFYRTVLLYRNPYVRIYCMYVCRVCMSAMAFSFRKL